MIVVEQAPMRGEYQYLGTAPRFDNAVVNRPIQPKRVAVDIGRFQAARFTRGINLAKGPASRIAWFHVR